MNQAIAEVVTRCELACGAEAVARKLPHQAGVDIYQGCVADALEHWSEDQFVAWVNSLEIKYLQHGSSDQLRLLYSRVCEIMGEYVPLLKAASDRPGS